MAKNTWSNTGGNGPASAVWVRSDGRWTAEIKVMPYRCLVTMYCGGISDDDHDGIPFATLAEAQRWSESFIARQAARHVACTCDVSYGHCAKHSAVTSSIVDGLTEE